MTDDFSSHAGTDQLEGRLRALHPETDDVILAESSAVRRRGTRRRRATRAGTVLGVAVLAVGVVGVASTLVDRPASAPPATTSPSPQTVLAADPFLDPGDVAQIGAYGPFGVAPDGSGDVGMRLTCLSDPASWGATVTRSQVYFSDLDATFVETVLQFPDAASAEAAAGRPLAEFAACPQGDPADAAVSDRSTLSGVGDQSYRLSRLTTPTTESEPGYNEVGVAREGAVVIVLDWSSMGSPVDAPGWAWTTEQLGIALEQAVA